MGTPRMTSAAAVFWALVVAWSVLPDGVPSRERAPARAAASAAVWAWVRATTTMPTSTARATKPHRAIRLTATSGRMEPSRRRLCIRLRMVASPSVGLAEHDRPGLDVHGARQEAQGRQDGLVAAVDLDGDRLAELGRVPGADVGPAGRVGLVDLDVQALQRLARQALGDVVLDVAGGGAAGADDRLPRPLAGGVLRELADHDEAAILEDGEHEDETGADDD